MRIEQLILVAMVGSWFTPSASATVQRDGTISHCRAVDGDTLHCGAERIRLLGIDSPEMPGHCRPRRPCVPGNPFAARAALREAIGRHMAIRRMGRDHFGRTLALVTGPLGDLSCRQIRAGHARYGADWDMQRALGRRCMPNRLQAASASSE